jgi:predicted nucleotidyltransferase
MMEPPVKEIVRRIVEAFHPRRIIMFGSRARGTARPGSDLDLMVEMETRDPPAQRARAIDALFGLRRWAMDLVVYTPVEVKQQRQHRNSLVRVIESEGTVLYEQPG